MRFLIAGKPFDDWMLQVRCADKRSGCKMAQGYGIRMHKGLSLNRLLIFVLHCLYILAACWFLGAAISPSVLAEKTTSQASENQEECLPPFKHKYSSRHFTIYSVTDTCPSKFYADYLEQFLLFVDAHIARISPGWKLTYYLYPDSKVLNSEGCFTTPRKKFDGRLNRARNAVFSFDSCGVGILSHELIHKVMNENFKEIEPWAHEGIPTFFEMLYGYRTSSGSVLIFGYQNPSRLKELGDRLLKLSLKGIIDPSDAVDPYNQADKRLLATFIFYEGKLFDYMRLAEAGEHRGYATLVEAAFAQKLDVLEPRFRHFRDLIVTNRKQLEALPNAHYFESKDQFLNFLHNHVDSMKAEPVPTQVLDPMCHF